VTRLEDELRATCAARTAELPALEDAADRAIRRAVRTRRRHATLIGFAVVVTVVLVGIGVMQVPLAAVVQAPIMAEASASVQMSTMLGIRLDLRVGNQLWTADGRRLPLPGVGAVTFVYRVPAGWVYSGTAGILRMVLSDGAPTDLHATVDTAVVSMDGEQIAWSAGTPGGEMLTVGQLTGTGVDTVAQTKVAAPAQPVAIVGKSVVVGRDTVDGKPAGYDVWSPPETFAPTWPLKLASVYGDAGDGTVIGLTDAGDQATDTRPVNAGQRAKVTLPDGEDPDVAPARTTPESCLIRYSLAGFAQHDTKQESDCGLALTPRTARGSTSPDGQWLVTTAAKGLMFVNLTDPSPQPSTRLCPTDGGSAPAWEDSSAVLVATAEGLVRCGLDGTRRLVPVTGLPAGDWDVVPALGA
jgi:hypothetical protein